MASNLTTRLKADTTQHNQAIKKSAKEVYEYKKRVDSAKNVLGKFAKKIPEIAGLFGVATGAMATFNKMLNQTQTATDTWGTATKMVNGALDTMANRLSGVGFGNFIDGLKQSAQAAREAYKELDQLGTMTIWQDKATADYNLKRAQYERIIKDKTSTPKQVKEAQAGLKKLREEYVKGQKALADQSMKTYYSEMNQLFANAGVNVSQGFINKYLGSQSGYDQALKDYTALYNKMQKKKRWVDTYDFNTGMKNGGYWEDNNSDEDKRRLTALQVVVQASDEKLKEANAHYINARNVETKLVEDATQQMMMNNKADARINKSTGSNSEKTTEEQSTLEQLQNQLEELQKKKESLFTVDDNGNVIFDKDKVKEIDAQIQNLTNTIEKLKSTINPNSDFTIPDGDNFSNPDEYYKNLDKYKESWNLFLIDCAESADNYGTNVYNNLKSISSGFNELMNNYKNLKSLFENDDADFVDYFTTITSVIFSTVDAIANIGTAFRTISELTQSLNSAEVVLNRVRTMANEAVMESAITAYYAPLGMYGVAPAEATIAAYKALITAGMFSNGGIVSGGTSLGDMNLARVNSGEMILNSTQQARLFRMLDSSVSGVNQNTTNGTVSFRISGNDLVGVLNNYENKKGRVR